MHFTRKSRVPSRFRLFPLLTIVLLLVAQMAIQSAPLAAAERVRPRDKIDAKLMVVMQTAAADEMISVIVELREKENLNDLKEQLRKNQIKKIIQRLQRKAQQTQRKVIANLSP